MAKKAKIETISEKEVAKRVEKGQFLARAILEMVGKPKEHILDTLHDLITQLSENDKYGLVSYDIAPAEKVKDSDLFSTFAEVEFTSKDEIELIYFATDFMPASIEVIEPAEMKVQASYTSHMLTEFVGRLHTIDMEFKKVNQTNKVLSQSLGVMIKNSILILLNMGPRKLEDISKIIGVDEDQTKTFLDNLHAEKKIAIDGDAYKLP